MRKRLLFLTPHHSLGTRHDRWDSVLERYRAALKDLEVDIDAQAWSLAIKDDYDLICPLVVWGYHLAPAAFRSVLHEIRSKGLRLLNPAEIIKWNIDKHYLHDLSQAGVRTVPSLYCETISLARIQKARLEFACQTLIVKPTISAGAKDTFICDNDDLSLASNGPVMIQPFMKSVQSEGEWSLVFLGGVFSHALLKTPKSGDFRSQPDYDARLQNLPAPQEALDLAYQALDYVSRDSLLYARIDMVRNESNEFCLMEMELIEPDLYLSHDEHAAAQFSHAFKHALGLCQGHDHKDAR